MTFTEVAADIEIVQAKRLSQRHILAWNGEIDAERFGWRALDLRLRKGPFEGPAIVKAPGFAGAYLLVACFMQPIAYFLHPDLNRCVSRSGFSVTGPIGDQLCLAPLQRRG